MSNFCSRGDLGGILQGRYLNCKTLALSPRYALIQTHAADLIARTVCGSTVGRF
jgi:hypothetical protein